ncbi:unnamed protein product [Didymodactylos carnosus]|uniref:BED-type domain-containing protein n=1 Tax=Didymodactylos carnosus TaxID=1234261 RepID=A0A8S2F1H7_9BILA|nr:unnamed protein product [Didymodactylos carnosus]CAF4102970.1 unnamed protein product [Didymodactylos carnosus]
MFGSRFRNREPKPRFRKREATGLKSAPLTKRSKKVKETSGEDSSSATENDSKYVSAMRKADVWEFATYNEQTGKGDCKFCPQSISLSEGSTSALRKHLRRKHKKLLPTENENVQPKIDRTLKGKKNENACLSIKSPVLDNAVVAAIIKDHRSFNDFNREGMKIFVKAAVGSYSCPSRSIIRTKLKRLYKTERQKVKTSLESVKSLSITTDVWSNRKQESYFTLTGHYFEDDNLDRIKHTILSFKSFNGSHTADRYASKIQKELEKLNLESKTFTMTTDGAANVKNMCTILETTNGIKPIYCVAHGLHLTICNALRLWPKKAKNKNYSDAVIEAFLLKKTDDLQYSTEYSDDNTDLEQTTEGDNQNKSGYESSEEIMNSSSTEFSSESDHNEDNNNDHSSEEIEITIDDAREVITSITNVLLKCCKLVNHFRRSTKQTGYLKKRIGKTLRCHSLIIDCPIRWNSSFSMIDRLITLKNHINAILNDTNKQNTKKVAKIYLTTFEWSMIGDLRKLLKPFKM